MKVAVTAAGTEPNCPVDPYFARARYFLVVDLGTDTCAVHNNTDAQRISYLAGTQAAGSLVSLGIDAAITMNIGPKAFATLRSAGVQIFQANPGTVQEALNLFRTGRLAELSQPNVEEYWPQQSGS